MYKISSLYIYIHTHIYTLHRAGSLCCLAETAPASKSFSHVQLFVTSGTIARQAPLSMGFSRQEYRTGSPYPPPGDRPNPGIKPVSLMSPALAGGFFTTSATWEAQENGTDALICRAEIETRCRDVENQRLDTKGIWDELGDWD